ncbi:MAG: hypothetical protein A2X80_10850 [Geobacteraceae bacterium GWB2_52_12]|nr:MAG: hypothetical protein A2X80_10850 [Geobacteraceae bacterium GWB2_52_12]
MQSWQRQKDIFLKPEKLSDELRRGSGGHLGNRRILRELERVTNNQSGRNYRGILADCVFPPEATLPGVLF